MRRCLGFFLFDHLQYQPPLQPMSSKRNNVCSAGDNTWSAKQQIEWLHANCPADLVKTKKATATKAAVVTAPSKKAVGLWYNHIMTHIFDYASAGYCVTLGQSNRIGRLAPSTRKYKAPGADKPVDKTRIAFKASSTLVITAGDMAAAKARSGKWKPSHHARSESGQAVSESGQAPPKASMDSPIAPSFA